MIEKKVIFIDKEEMRLRRKHLISHVANGFSSNVNIVGYYGNKDFAFKINVKSLMGMYQLIADHGMDIRIIIEGKDEKEAAEAILRLFEIEFEEICEIHQNTFGQS